jgi:hypothetical protein
VRGRTGALRARWLRAGAGVGVDAEHGEEPGRANDGSNPTDLTGLGQPDPTGVEGPAEGEGYGWTDRLA